ncbi:Pleckstrin homology-like domain [Phaffia rhodozyma]|uniref:Pleckstrin homology-like domain n=1 Tax=Phaffia rhodozyma TaxID=264483 RepID=A0A0F7SP34_PHARH|nr:Pleckstrin homology-like domain [Phaffia rhodozyma]
MGWSPLRIQKRSQTESPNRPSSLHHTISYDSDGTPTEEAMSLEEPLRRTSSSYKHLKTNSLVSNSIFKQDASPQLSDSTPKMMSGENSPTKAFSGNGWGSPRKSPGAGWKHNTGYNSNDEGSSDEEDEEDLSRVSPERKLDFKARTKGRQSMGLVNLPKQGKVTSSPFLKQRDSTTTFPLESPTKPSVVSNGSEVSNVLTSSFESTSADEDDETEQIVPENSLSIDHSPHPSPLESSTTSAESSPSQSITFSPYNPNESFPSPPPSNAQISFPSERETPSTPHRPTSIPSHMRQNITASPSPKSNLKARVARTGGSGTRERRKTVTFEDRPEVSFFEKDASLDYVESPIVDDNSPSSQETFGSSPIGSESGMFEYDHSPPWNDQFSVHPEHHLPTDSSYDLLPQPASLPEDASYTSLVDLNDVSYGSYDGAHDPFSEANMFVNDLLKEADLLTPGSVSSAHFPETNDDTQLASDDDAPSYIDEGQELKEEEARTAGVSAHGTSYGYRGPEEFRTELSLGAEIETSYDHPKIDALDLPHLRSSPADPILLNGNVLEPSTFSTAAAHHSPISTARIKQSTSTTSLSSVHWAKEDVQAHQSGPLPDPFLTLQTVQNILTSPSPKMKRSGSSTRSIAELTHGLPKDQQGIPYGRTHHSERRFVRRVLKDGIGIEEKSKDDLEDLIREDKENSFLKEVEGEIEEKEEAQRRTGHPLVGTRGLVLSDLNLAGEDEKDVFGDKIEVVQALQSPARRVSSSTPSKSLPRSSSNLMTLDDNPYSLPDFGTHSPLFYSSEDTRPSLDEFGTGSAKPSSSADRFKLEEFGDLSSLNRNGFIASSAGAGDSVSSRSSSGRSPRLTRESVRRRMDARKKEAEEQAVSDLRSSPTKKKTVVDTSGGWKPLDGLGIGLPDESKSERYADLPEHEGLPSPSTSTCFTSLSKAPAPSSSKTERPQIPNRGSALSAKEILSAKSALEELATGMGGLSFYENAHGNSEERIGEVKERSIILESKKIPSESSSTPVEEYSALLAPSGQVIGLTASTSAEQAKRDSELMPPPPVPSRTATAATVSAPPISSDRASSSPSSSWLGGDLDSQSKEEAAATRKRAESSSTEPTDVNSVTPRPRRKSRRSMSAGEIMMDDFQQESSRNSILIDKLLIDEKDGDGFGESLVQEIHKIADDKNHRYRLVQHQQITASDEKVSHSRRAGDLDKGRSWRSVKRPSDMNEYAQEIREIRAREKPGRAHAKVFVKIVSITDVDVPFAKGETPQVRIALNNGLHSVETGTYPLREKVDIGQEFELLGLDNLEFSFAVKVKKDASIVDRIRAVSTPPPIKELPTTPTKQSGFRKLMASPRRPKPVIPVIVRPEPPKDDLVRYLAPDGTLAVVKVVFKDIASRCNGQLLSLHLPLTGRWNQDSITQSRSAGLNTAANRSRTIGRMELQLMMIPSLPGLSPEQLPQSLDDAIIGLRHVRWHKMDYFNGTLTQSGGDCTSWRRRRMRIVGGTLEASNDVTGKITARIDLSQMTNVTDNNMEDSQNPDMDRPMSVERSFTLTFENGEDIQFYADTDKDKEDWINHLNELLGRVPSLPLWAELLWVKDHPAPSSEKSGAGIPSSPRS